MINRKRFVRVIALIGLLVAITPAMMGDAVLAQGYRLGVLGKKAPEWNIHSWIDADGKTTDIKLEDYKGKVVYLLCFQSW